MGRYEEAGVEEVWCTPHVMEDVPNTTGAQKARFEDLKAAYDGPIVLHLAAEYMMDHLFDLRLDADDILCHGDGEKAEWLMDHGLYSYAGSDLHSSHMLDMIMEGKVFKKLW